MKRRLLLACALLLLLALALEYGRMQERIASASQATLLPADAIFLLGGGDESCRAREALRLYRHGLSPRIVMTGVKGQVKGQALQREALQREALQRDARYALLLSQGVPLQAITLDSSAANTIEEGSFAYRMAKEHHWSRLAVVSEAPHLSRIALLWEPAFAASGTVFSLHACSNAGSNQPWWSRLRSVSFVMSELLKSLYWRLRGFCCLSRRPASLHSHAF